MKTHKTENGMSKIEWTDFTFNPWIGCTKIAPECKNCYAESNERRFGRAEWGKGKPRYKTKSWQKPLTLNNKAIREGKRYKLFCASLADVFDEEVPDTWRDELFELVKKTPNLDWQILTKRPEVAKRYIFKNPLPENVWLGVTAGTQKTWDKNIPILLDIPNIQLTSI